MKDKINDFLVKIKEKDEESLQVLKELYSVWIEERYNSLEKSIGKCREATSDMKMSFPWLKLKRGLVFSNGEEYPHWWLVCPFLSEIIDPTSKQFNIIFGYEELPDDDPRCLYKRQKCMNCGEVYYADSANFCSEECLKELDDFFNGKD